MMTQSDILFEYKTVKSYLSSFPVFSSILKILFGLWLLNPYWNTFASTPSYRVLSLYASEEVFGAVAFLLGVIQLIIITRVLLRDKITTLEKQSYTALGYMSMFYWFIISFTIALANIAATGTSTYLTIAVFEFLSVLDLKGISDLYRRLRK